RVLEHVGERGSEFHAGVLQQARDRAAGRHGRRHRAEGRPEVMTGPPSPSTSARQALRCVAASAVTLLVILAPRLAQAQSFEIGGGVALAGGYHAGSATASETRNPSTGSAPLTLFQTDSRVLRAVGVDVHAGVYVTKRLLVGAEFQYSRPTLRTHTSA